MVNWNKIGIVAGGGALPIRLAQSCLERNIPFFIIRLKGMTDPELKNYHGVDCPIGEAGKVIKYLNDNNCDAVSLCGMVARPDFKNLSIDIRGAAMLPRLIKAAGNGDGAILSVLVDTFESEGFKVVGAEDVLKSLTVHAGVIAGSMPTADHFSDIKKAAEVVNALGPFDVGQGAVVIAGQVVAIEAAEGTDAMLKRCALLRERNFGFGTGGILLKRPKPGQELRVDLPTIGVETIKNAAAAGLSGITVEAGAALIVDLEETVAEADRLGIFLYGFQVSELAG